MKRRTSRWVVRVVVAGLVAVAARSASGDTIPVIYEQVGGFYGPHLPPDDALPVPTPDNDPSFQNYFLGRTTVSGFTTSERRAFFVFDMAGVSALIPPGEEVVGVGIDLEHLFGGVLANFTPGGMEVVDFTSTSSTYAEILDPAGHSLPPEAIWGTFGTGTPYGSLAFFGLPTPSPPTGTVTIGLPGALDDVKSAIAGDEIFIVTARLVSYDPGPIADDKFEFVFGLTDVEVGGPTPFPDPTLVLETAPLVPEPSTFALAALGSMCVGLMAWRRRRRAR